MTIYVDEINTYPSGQWCHMMSDSGVDELHTMAAKLGLRRAWFQNKPRFPHYDLRPSKRLLAIKLGAVAVESDELVTRCRVETAARPG